MFQFILKKFKSFIGLDIQSHEIRLVELRRYQNTIHIETAGIQALPAGSITEGKIQQSDQVSAAVQELMRKTAVKGVKTAIALPQRAIISKKIQLLENLSESEYEADIMNHLPTYFPGVTEALAADFVTRHRESPLVNILLFAARAQQLQSYIDVAKQAGLLVTMVDIDTYAISRAVQFLVRDQSLSEAMVVLEIGMINAQCWVIQKDEIIFHQFFLPLQQQPIVQQLKNALQLCQTHHRMLSFTKIYVIGMLTDWEDMSWEIVSLNVFDEMNWLKPDGMQTISAHLFLSVGLALRGVLPA